MGEPDSITNENIIKQLALNALGPSGKVSARILRETGLHREFLQLHYQSIQSEIKYLVGWKPLREFGYTPLVRWPDENDQARARARTGTWLEVLSELGVAEEHAVLVFDGELRQVPAPDYRLFVLRDGRMLYYAGGLYGNICGGYFACGDVLEVLDVMDKKYSAASCATTLSRQPFVIVMQALTDALDRAVKDREAKVRQQRALQERLQQAIQQVSAK